MGKPFQISIRRMLAETSQTKGDHAVQSIAGSIVILAGTFLFAFGTGEPGRWSATCVALILMLFGAGIILVDTHFRQQSHRPRD
jgi:hypothetical protein